MPPPSKSEQTLLQIIEHLVPTTEAGKLDWGESRTEEGVFQVFLGKGQIQIMRRDTFGRSPVSIRVCTSHGRCAYEVSSQETAALRLYELVRRRVLRTDEVLTEMLAELALMDG